MALVPAGLAQRAIERHQKEIGDADGGELAQAALIVPAIGIDHRHRRRQAGFGRVVVKDDAVEADRLGFLQCLVGRDAAVDRDDQVGPLPAQQLERLRIGAIAFRLPVGHIEPGRHAKRLQETQQQGGGGGAVHVIVAEDGNTLAGFDGPHHPRHRPIHVGEAARVGKLLAQARLEEARHGLAAHAAHRQGARHRLRQAVLLHQAENGTLVRFAKQPALAARRTFDA